MVVLCALTFVNSPVRAADGIEITQAQLESSEEGYRLSLSAAFELNRGLEDALTRGVPLYFRTEVEITRPRWYWFDEKAISASQTARISHNALTNQYHVSVNGRPQQSVGTLDEAMSLLQRPARWVVADKDALSPGQPYNVAVRIVLDVTRLGKPFQIHAINSSDWRFSSDWKQFNFRAQ